MDNHVQNLLPDIKTFRPSFRPSFPTPYSKMYLMLLIFLPTNCFHGPPWGSFQIAVWNEALNTTITTAILCPYYLIALAGPQISANSQPF